jgi:AraC-like DNA-binding protein
MTTWTTTLQATSMCLALLWLLLALAQPRKPILLVVWAVFCASLALMLAKQLAGASLAPWHYLLGLGACATCNGFWLVARALFRAERPFGAVHLFYAGSIGLLIVISQLLGLLGSGLGWIDAAWRQPLAAALNQLLDLLSSTALVLAFWEGVRAWSAHTGAERRMRVVFLAAYGGCVAISSLVPALAAAGSVGAELTPFASAAAALCILLVAQGLVRWRLRNPLGASLAPAHDGPASTDASPAAPAPRAARQRRARPRPASATRIGRWRYAWNSTCASGTPYLDAEFKLAQLARALDVGEYRVSRAIHVLGHRNIAHYINAYRIRHACRLLDDRACDDWSTLVIGLESGFGSLGAFHRAFKTQVGCTPGDYRLAAEQATAALPRA